MQDFPGGPWDLAGYDLLRWHSAINLLPRSSRVVTLKNNLSTLENIVSVLTAISESELEREPSLFGRSVNENEGAVELSGPSSTIRVRRAPASLPHPSTPATGPPAPVARPRPRGVAYPVVGAFENIPPVSSFILFIFLHLSPRALLSAYIARISQFGAIGIQDPLVADA